MTNQKPLISFSTDDYAIIDREVVYSGVFTFCRYHLRHRMYDGTMSPVLTREMLERKHAAGVLLYDSMLDCVVLIEQFRPGAITPANEQKTSPWLTEIVAGILDEDENPEELAIREAFEEAGCKILDLQPIAQYYVSPGGSNEYIYLYCGHIDASKAGGIFGLHNEHEDIRAFILAADKAFQLLEEGKLTTAPAIISLQWLKLNRERLRALWQRK